MTAPLPGFEKGPPSHLAYDLQDEQPCFSKSLPKLANPFIVPDDQPCPENRTMFQGFEWYCPADFKHWQRLAKVVPSLAALGITSMWIPPAAKGAHSYGNGYDTYDLYDLGEFNQKGARPTKWGTKEQLADLVKTANAHGIGILFDAVLNHKAAADYTESVLATKVDPQDRTEVIGKPETIEAWTGFEFKGRHGAYSTMKWNKSHFTGIDYDNNSKKKAVWLFEGKTWAEDVDEELGNYDYLMFADIDHNHPQVKQDLFLWVQWLASQLKLGGLRLDAIKHYSGRFLQDLLLHIDQTVDQDWFIVGEYWREDSEVLAKYIEYMYHRISLFDVKLVSNFSRISLRDHSDMRTIFDGSLVSYKPFNAVTFVVNHDTQDGQSLETPVAPYFIPIAYCLILLRANAGLPCVFYSDLYGSFGRTPMSDRHGFIPPTSGGAILPKIILARQLYAYGSQFDYFDEPHCIGFTRLGHPSRAEGAGLAVVMTNGWEFAMKRMYVGEKHAGERWTDILCWGWGETVIDSGGWGVFPVGPRSVSLWASKTASGRELLDEFVFNVLTDDPSASAIMIFTAWMTQALRRSPRLTLKATQEPCGYSTPLLSGFCHSKTVKEERLDSIFVYEECQKCNCFALLKGASLEIEARVR